MGLYDKRHRPANCKPMTEQDWQRYNPVAVNQAIEASNRAGRKISTKEARMIHALLKGRH
ncbi:MAG TPA: hypothetical protein VGC77_11850 [Rhodopseudomonas sp.]|uniref:hypothetical protein n=1 Tax=Rhodopseudomonas sp. TaxID=1078 RepID=UPI002EDACE43